VPDPERADFIAMWPNQPVKVCQKHAGQIARVGSVIGVQVPFVQYVGDEKCSNCVNEAKAKVEK